MYDHITTNPVDGWLLLCLNYDCSNTYIKIDSGNIIKDKRCKLCKKEYSTIAIKTSDIVQCETDLKALSRRLPEHSLLEQELIKRSQKVNWVEKQTYDNWPGPIAYEYVQLKETLSEGRLEAACWKLFNLIEVIVLYLHASKLERNQQYLNNKTIKNKLNSISWAIEKSLYTSLKDIIHWRNSFGTGHGTLVRNREEFLENVVSFTYSLNGSINGLTEYLRDYRCSLFLKSINSKEENIIELKGVDYYLLIKGDVINSRVTCHRENRNHFYPVKLFGYNFDSLDVYFYDRQEDNLNFYRNFSKNRIKVVCNDDRPKWKIEDERNIQQVAWLNSTERDLWLQYVGNRQETTINQMIIDAADGYQKRGMYQSALQLIRYYHARKQEEELLTDYLNINKVKYELYMSTGKYRDAAETLELINKKLSKLKNKDVKLRFQAELFSSQGWHEGVKKRDTESAINTLSKGIEVSGKMKNNFPFTAFVIKLELEKNILYINRYKIKDKNYRLTPEECTKLKNKCLHLFLDASILFNSNPEDHRFVDIIGFACNLYGQYGFYLQDECGEFDNEGEEQKRIFDLYKYGEKIRYKAYQAMPDDIWLLRGYAWSIHSGARVYKKIENDTVKQKQLLREALERRVKYHERFPGDIEVPEDIFSNLEELLGLDDLDNSEIIDYIKMINDMYDIIKKNDIDTPRLDNLTERRKKVLEKLNIN